jgi:hypothetical protein
MPQKLTPEIILAAISGFEAQKSQIDSQIAELRSMLDGGSRTIQSTAPSETAKPRKKFSAAARKKMALAQKARWTKLKEAAAPKEAEAVKPKKKRKMSAAGRKAISETTKKRWAAVKAAKKAAA